MPDHRTEVIEDGLPSAGVERVLAEHRALIRPKIVLFTVLLGLLAALVIWSIAVGSYDLSLVQIIRALLGLDQGPQKIVVWTIRMPRILAAVVAGAGLGLSGITIQSLVRNPLASPFTLGISQGAAFGAAFSIVVLEAGGMLGSALRTADTNSFMIHSIYAVTICAFAGGLAATLVILFLARIKKMSPQSIILAGVAMSSLFTSGTILVQYFATDIEIATVVFWTFGDVGRSSWPEIGLLFMVTGAASIYFILNRWTLNAMAAGEETAQSLGVNVNQVRLTGMFLATLVAALVTSFHGVIAFLGLLAPHIGRRLVGADHQWSVPYACLIGSLLLLASDTLGRMLVGSGALPVGVLTSFMGAPLFLFLLMKGNIR